MKPTDALNICMTLAKDAVDEGMVEDAKYPHLAHSFTKEEAIEAIALVSWNVEISMRMGGYEDECECGVVDHCGDCECCQEEDDD